MLHTFQRISIKQPAAVPVCTETTVLHVNYLLVPFLLAGWEFLYRAAVTLHHVGSEIQRAQS